MCSFLFPLLAVIFLREKTMVAAVIVLGQAHFLLTYLQQWREGRVDGTYGALYVLACAGLFTALSFIPEPQLWTLVAAGSVFAVHFFLDEIHISGLSPTKEMRFLGIAFVLLYTALLLRYAYGVTAPLLIAPLAFAACAPLVISRLRAQAINASEMFLLSGVGILLVMIFIPKSIGVMSALGYIILFHCTRWYLFNLFKFFEEPEQVCFKGYIRDVIMVNVILAGCFIFYATFSTGSFFSYLFSREYFFAWTILHVLFSIHLSKRASLAPIAHASVH